MQQVSMCLCSDPNLIGLACACEDMSRKGGGTLTLKKEEGGGGKSAVGGGSSLSRDFHGRCYGDLGNARWLTLGSNPHHLVRF